MFKNLLFVLLAGASLSAFAANDASGVIAQDPNQAQTATKVETQAQQKPASAVKATPGPANNPTVNSFMYSGSQFPQQNQLSGKKNQKYYSSQELKKHTNNPNVSSFAYSGSQFPQQNQLTGKKHEKYYTSQERKQQKNNPVVNSRLYSGAQFPQQNQLNSQGSN